jgi:hypothetical protein
MPRVCVGLVLFAATGTAAAGEPLRFKFQPGQVLTYSVRQLTRVTETAYDETAKDLRTGTSVTKLALVRRWAVTAVDPAGVATLEMSIASIRQEISRPGPADKDGKPTADDIVIDSATPEGKQQTAEYLGKPIVTVRLDPQGRLVEAKAAGGAADRLAAEPPFRLTLPDAAVAAGSAWRRPFPIKLAPPLGTGESFDAVQTYTLKAVADGTAVVAVASALKATPADPGQLPPLVPLLWEGEVYFQPATGRYAGAKLGVKREVPDHQGAGTKFVYESQYAETLEK